MKRYMWHCSHLHSLVKFFLFLVFTVTYCYFAYITLPKTKPRRPTVAYYSNNTQFKHKRINTKSDYDWTNAEREFENRRQAVQAVCEKYGDPKIQPNAWEFIIDARHSLIWCNVFKAASSSWMYNFNLLGGYEENYLRISNKNPITLLRSKFPRPTIHQLLSSLPNSLSFLIVRDPFHRLLSAYRNKMEHFHTQYYQRLAKTIVKRYRGQAPSVGTSAPTFTEFVKYVTETHGRADEHWAPIYKFCTPCVVNFTIIVKLETLSRDQEYIIHRAGLNNILTSERMQYQNRARDSMRTQDLIQQYYSKLNAKLIDKLVSLYDMDFKMFGYNYSQYYDIVNS